MWTRSKAYCWKPILFCFLFGVSGWAAELEDTLQNTLTQLEANQESLADFNQLQGAAQRFKAANREAQFRAWLQERLKAATTPMAKVNLAWHLQDYQKATEELTRATKTALYIQEEWKERFKKVDRGQYLNLLAALVKANPSNSVARLEWLDAADNLGDAERIASLEQLLRPDAPNAFPVGKGVRNGTQFKNYFELAFRLMRLYERGQKLEELRALGLRIARGEKPFRIARWEYDFKGENAEVEEGCACLALAVQYASDKNYQAELLKALKSSSWSGARAQLERRIKKEAENPTKVVTETAKLDSSWANAPEGVKLLASDENVLSVARDEEFVYAGHPWGVAVYDFTGKVVTHVLLGEAANCLANGNGEMWVGSPKGLFQIQRSEKGWSVSHLWLDGDVPQKERSPLPGPYVYYSNNGVQALAFEGEELWIGMSRGVQMLNTRTRELRAFSLAEMKLKNRERFNSFLIDKNSVQADSRQGSQRRYDRKTGVWEALPERKADSPSQVSEITLLGGTRVIGRRNTRANFEQPSPAEGLNTSLVDDTAEGLLFVTTDGVSNRISRNFSQGLEGDNVLSILFDEKEDWLCSTHGLTRISPEGQVLEKFTRANGLPGNLVWNGVKAAGKLYFACGWEDAGGGLTVYDPAIAVFTWYRQVDGMDSSRLDSVQLTANNQIRLTYGREYLRSSFNSDKRYRQSLPGLFDPQTVQFSSGETPKLLTMEEARSPQRPERQAFPCLGGFVIQRYEHDGYVYLCGTRGLLITKPGPLPNLVIPEMQVKLLLDKSNQNLADAASRKIKVQTPEELAEALKDPNPIYRANALESVYSIKDRKAFFPLLKTQVHDPELRVRVTAYNLLLNGNDDPDLIPVLRDCLNEPNLSLRTTVIIELAKRGEPIPMTNLQEVIEERDNVRRFQLYSALGPQLTPELMAKMIEFPIQVNDYAPYREALQALGIGARKHPEVLPVLLHAKLIERKNLYPWEPIRFAQEIIGYAGKEFVPELIKALTNQEPIVRANAARACGKMGATSAIPTLLKVLDTSNNPVQGPVVWALGELKAEAALPRLIKLYAEIRPDEERKSRENYLERLSQSQVFPARTSAAEENDRYQTWKASGPPRQPQLSNMVEETLKSENILDAIGKIGSKKAQPFYRELALGQDARDRAEAAIPLGQASAADRATNIAILKTLSIDRISSVRVRASVGLLMLGETSSQEFLRDRLRNGNNVYERMQIIRDLELLPRGQLAFIANDLSAIANSEKAHTALRNLAQAQYDRYVGKNSEKH